MKPIATPDACGTTEWRAPGWDLRTAICRAEAADLPALEDEVLMFLFRTAADPKDLDELCRELYRRYYRRVSLWCSRTIGHREGLDDLAQDVFLRAFRYRETFRGEARLSTWLYTLTRNRCLSVLKKASGDPMSVTTELNPAMAQFTGSDVHHDLEHDEQIEMMWRLIRTRLSAMEARILTLHYAHGLPLGTITRELALSNPSGAKAYIVNAKRKLNAVLRTRRKLRAAA